VTHCRSDFIIESSSTSHTSGRGTRTTTTTTGTFDHANPKRKKLIKKSEAVSQLYPKFFRHYNHVGEATMHRFSHLFCFGFYALVFDSNLQILGTFDFYVKKFIPGVRVVPPYLRKFSNKDMESRIGGNLMEINFAGIFIFIFILIYIYIYIYHSII
jgi:hypothetical protein